MARKPYKTETKETVTIRLYPSVQAKAKRLGVNLSQILHDAIAAMPEPGDEKSAS